MTLYLKYRPQKLEDLDSAEVRESLKRIVASGKIPHAFLFAGPKGIGKTSAARILAKIVNCELNFGKKGSLKIGEPCDQCDQCTSIIKGENLDVVEIDAASHRGIDDIRALNDAVKLAPIKARKKVYIIDEAHMLTPEASNALLKTLEEPPNHVMFILATTEPNKLIPTIRSRTTLINFKKASFEEIARSLERVVKGEKLDIDKDILLMIAEFADGSFRDGVKILDQMISEGIEFNSQEVAQYLSKSSVFVIDKFIKSILNKDPQEAIEMIEKAIEKGLSAKDIALKIISYLREKLLVKIGIGEGEESEFSKQELIELIKLFTSAAREIPQSLIEQSPLEIAIIEWCSQGKEEQKSQNLKEENFSDKRTQRVAKNQDSSLEEINSNQNQNLSSNPQDDNGIDAKIWIRILSEIKPRNTSTEALLRAAKPLKFDGKTLELGVFYSFHKDRLMESPHRVILEEVVSQVVGGKVRVICSLTQPPQKVEAGGVILQEVTKEDESLTSNEDQDIIEVAKEIFGQ